MNKRNVNLYLGEAVSILEDVGIAKNGVIRASYRSQLSSFGSAVVMGSVLSAVALYADKPSSEIETERLMAAIYLLKHAKDKNIEELKKRSAKENAKALFEYVANNYASRGAIREEIKEYAVALKLAMNLYQLDKK